MALLALFGRLLEVHVDELRLQVGRFVAVNTGNGPVRTREWEGSRIVVEPFQFFPGLGRMATLTPHRLSVLVDLGHPLLELAVVHIFMTGGAG